jgi:tight adherence protein C
VTLLALLGLLLLGAAAALSLRAAVLRRVHMTAQVRQIETYGFESQEAEQSAVEPRSTPLGALAERTGRWTMASVSLLKPLEHRELLAAGIYEHTVERVHGWRVMAALGFPALVLALELVGGSASVLTVVVVCAVAVLAWRMSALLVRRRGQRRLDQVDRALPELIDVLTATIEAGLGFAGSLALCARRFEGALGQELRLMLQEQAMGLSTNEALENMRERCDTPSVRAFARAIGQGESLGVSIGTMMRNLASETRKRRRAHAHEQVQKAPVKLLFPLIFLIFPALLIVLLYPAVHNVLAGLGHA